MTEEKQRMGVAPSTGAMVLWHLDTRSQRYHSNWMDSTTKRYNDTQVIELTKAERLTLAHDNLVQVVELVRGSGHNIIATAEAPLEHPMRITVNLPKEGVAFVLEGGTVYRVDESEHGQNDLYFVQPKGKNYCLYGWRAAGPTKFPSHSLIGQEIQGRGPR